MQKTFIFWVALFGCSTTFAMNTWNQVKMERYFHNISSEIAKYKSITITECPQSHCQTKQNLEIKAIITTLEEAPGTEINILNRDFDFLDLAQLLDLYEVTKDSQKKFKIYEEIQRQTSSQDISDEDLLRMSDFAEFGVVTPLIRASASNIRQAQDLFQFTPSNSHYRNGHYSNGVQIFMFCRSNRSFKCLKLLKDKDGRIVKDNNNNIWTQSALALSKWGKPFYKKNGNTPSGIFRIDGVMPQANHQRFYGKYRRLILEFIEKSPSESTLLSLLPRSAKDHKWWKESVTARNNGRNLFRIHGTGLISDKSKSYFPLVPTSGCVAKKENKYGSKLYKDQRILLDKMMEAQGLTPAFKNEPKIKGLLYIINIDNKKKDVTLKDLIESKIVI